jgi:hypothetical protein
MYRYVALPVATTTLFDASIIASPTISPPSGTYALTLSTPTNTDASCLVDQSQAQAWSCNLAGNPALAISVGIPPGPKPTNGAFIFYASSDTEICYGTQYQFMETDFAPFLTVQDNDDLSKGPAFYFEQTYNKIVVLPEATFPVPPDPNNNKGKRQDNFQLPPGWGAQKALAKPGEKPWFCVWNNTLLEAFIYVTEPAAANSTALTTSTTASATANASAASSSTATSGSISTTTTSSPWAWSATSIPLTGSFTTTISNTVTTTTITAPMEAYSHINEQYHQGDGDGDADDQDPHKARLRARQAPPADAQDMYDTLDMYPYVVKLEERRMAGNAVQPYCQQYQILNNGQYGPTVYPNTNDPIIITLEEQDPTYSAYQSAGIAGSRSKHKRQMQIPNDCHCEWSSGE